MANTWVGEPEGMPFLLQDRHHRLEPFGHPSSVSQPTKGRFTPVPVAGLWSGGLGNADVGSEFCGLSTLVLGKRAGNEVV